MINTNLENDLNISILSELNFDDNFILQNLFNKIIHLKLTEIKKFNSLLSLHKNFLKLNRIPSTSIPALSNTNSININNLQEYVTVLKIYFLLEISRINLFEGKLNPSSGNVYNIYNTPSNFNSNAYKEFPIRGSKKDSVNLGLIGIINSNQTNHPNHPNHLNQPAHNNTYSETNTSLNKINNSDCNELSFRIYKMLFDEEINEIKIKELDYLTNLILNEYIVSKDYFLTFDKFTNIVECVANSTTSNNMKAILNLKITFENFLKYFKIIIYFFFYVDNYKNIFEILDFEGKNKILTAELIVCFNKLIRNLEDNNNIYIIITKKFMGLIDNYQIYLSKSEYYSTLIKSFSI